MVPKSSQQAFSASQTMLKPTLAIFAYTFLKYLSVDFPGVENGRA